MKRVAIVILNWNGASFLKRFLPGVISDASHLARIVVADNASTDDSVELLARDFPQVEIIRLERNFGFTGGYNRALAQLDADYFLLLNSDVETSSGWLEPLIDWMDKHPETAACQPKIRSYEHRNLFEHAGACGGFIDRLGYPFCRGRIMHSLEADTGQYDSPLPVFWATGACMMIRGALYKQAGGFDERFFAHMEEIDLCWRLIKQGHNIMVIPQSTVFHVGGGTLPKNNPRKTFYNFSHNLLMLTKNRCWQMLLWGFPDRV
ncbi:MAG: glycosyltransferase family 2 protein [Bacteroidota bacterium]